MVIIMRNRFSNGLWGLFFIVIGIGFAGNVLFDWNFNLFFPGFWTLFIIIPFLISIVQQGFRVVPTTGFLIGVLLLASYYVNFRFSIWQLIVPAIFIFIGIRIMFQNSSRRNSEFYEQSIHMDGGQGQNYTGRADYNAIFSGNKIHVVDTFTGASLNAVFGGVGLDLRDAIIPGNVEITAQAIFGGIDIWVPSGVNVKVNNVPVFGGVSNKTVSNNPAAPTIYLNSTCMFGGIDIK
jgi:Predicted membrane protein (DUF2154).